MSAGQEPLPDEPILRIDTGRHSAFVHALALDEVAGRAYSASEDKTVRVWRIADGRHLDTFRVPIGHRAEGQLYALALSPDGAVLAAAGWTCWDTEGRGCVYLLDAATGAMRGRIAGLPEVIAALRFSPDGTHLAVGLMGKRGLTVYRIADRTAVAEDTDYRDKLLELDFSPGGRLVTSSLDGFARLYDERFRLLGRVNAAFAGRQPFGIRYSPDGARIALGFNDVARVSVLKASDLSVERTLALDVRAGPRNITRVAWSPDGSAIYGAGEPAGSESAAVFRWRLANAAHAQSIRVARGRIGDIAITRDRLVLFASEDPTLGAIDAAGKPRYLLGSGIPPLGKSGGLRVSSDGSVVEIGLGAPASLRRFSVKRQQLERSPFPNEAVSAPLATAPGWKISRWGHDAGPLVNGRRVALEQYERAHVYAFAPDATLLVIGTEWAVRAFDPSGAQRWSVRAQTAVRTLNVSPDGRFVTAALVDGTIHWYSLTRGEPVLSLFLHADGESWVAWTRSGEYSSSPYGDTFVGWHVNRGAERSPDFFRAVQFERELYRPDVLAARLQSPRAFEDDARAGAAGARLLQILPPRVTLTEIQGGVALPERTRRVRVTAESLGLPMSDFAMYVNDIPLTASRDRVLLPAESTRFVRDIDVPLADKDNDVRIEIHNGRSLGVAERYLAGASPAAGPRARGDLYLLTVGANRFPDLSPQLHLSYAARDAQEFARAMRQIGARDFRRTYARTLSDDGPLPTRAAVLDSLQTLSNATGADTVVLFLASHGVSDPAGNYFFVPRDVRRRDLDLLLDGKPVPPDSSLIGWQPLFEALRKVAGRRILIVDTCHARNVTGRMLEHTLVKRSASSRIAFVLASAGDEESQEYAAARHGLFTFALLEGLKGSADADRDGFTRLEEWFAFAAGVVDRLRDRRIGSQTPQLVAPRALRTLPMLAASTK
ncbi:MAG: caspase family protein [Gammaproteobacteria bacterium]